MEIDIAKLSKVLKEHGYSMTLVRRTVFEVMAAHEALSMAEIIDHVGVVADRASVYRTISLFEQLGIAHRLYIGWKYKLELSDEFIHHHHHLACINCGRVIPLSEDASLEAFISTLAKNHSFKPTGHQLEISGYCSDCRAKK